MCDTPQGFAGGGRADGKGDASVMPTRNGTPSRGSSREPDGQATHGRVAGYNGLDDISKDLVELLQHDGRCSYAALAKAVGLSEAAVRQRVRRLLDEGHLRPGIG